MPKPMRNVSDVLRAELRSAQVTRYRIALDTGISQSTLSRFVRGRQGLDLDGVDRLARYLGLELVRRRTAER